MSTTVIIVAFKSEKKIYQNLDKFKTAKKFLLLKIQKILL